ncbi:MAG TPA: SIS domain-containing protein [Prolixibacteraceae bacterium]|nr:SIS domain-containing protein [Prolixibacteraceae bacterium]
MIAQRILQSIELKKQLLADSALLSRIEEAAGLIVQAYRSGNKTLFCGNGGSAADAQHLAAELSGKFYIDRPPIHAEACHVNSSFMTAVSNDFGFDRAYARYIEAVGKRGDVLVAISTSGNSENVSQALDQARVLGFSCVVLTGASGGRMAEKADILLNLPSEDTPRIQELHILVGHIICEMVEWELFGEKGIKG